LIEKGKKYAQKTRPKADKSATFRLFARFLISNGLLAHKIVDCSRI
jgi:hypothetical protein